MAIGAMAPLPPLAVRFGWRRRIRPILQSQSSECGLVCLAMVAEYHGASHDLRTLRNRVGLSSRGLSGAGILDAAYQMDLQATATRLDLHELRILRLPAILHFDMNHCVVLERMTKFGAFVVDPALGRKKIPNDQLSKRFTGVAFQVEPGAGFRKAPRERKTKWSDLVGRVGGLRSALGQILALATLLELLGLASPLLMQTIVDKVLTSGDRQLLMVVGGAFALLMVFQSVVSAARSWAMTCLGQQLSYNWVNRIYAHLIRLPDGYFARRHLGDVVSRFDSVAAIQQTMTTRIAEVVLDGTMGLFTLVLMAHYSRFLTGIAIVAVLVYAVLRFTSFRLVNESNVSEITANATQQTHFIESVRGVTAIRLFNRQSAQTARYMATMATTFSARATLESIHLLFGTAHTLLFGLLRICLLLVGAHIALRGDFTTGMLVAFTAYADRFAVRASSLIDFLIDMKMMRMHVDRIADITEEPAEYCLNGTLPVEPKEPSVEFRNVSFRYSKKDPWILGNCSFRVEAGQAACIIGTSGAGKSTIIKLMCGLLDPVEGQILIGGVSIEDMGKSRVRLIMNAVMQDDSLFSGSLGENITFFDEQSDVSRMEWSAQMAAIADDIHEMPMRYETLVGDMGSSLSGGQRQRVLLARAIYAKPLILLTDEATSHLDATTEMRVLGNIESLKITRIAVAHRQETVRLADVVLELADKRVVARPCHHGLAPAVAPPLLA